MLQPNTDLGDTECWTTTATGENTPTFEKHFGGLLYRKGHRAYRDWETDRKSTRLNSSHRSLSRMPSSA